MESKFLKTNYFLIEAVSGSEDKYGVGQEIESNNFVGKREKSYTIVGLTTIGLWINSKLFYAVRDNPLRSFQKPGRLGHVSSGVFESINDQLFLIVLNCPFEGKGRDRTGLFSGLKGWREMIAVDHLIRAEQDGSLHAVFEFSHIAWPMVLHEHVNGRSGYPSDFLLMFLVEFFNKMVSQEEDVRLPLPKGRDEDREYVQTVI